MKQLTQRSRPVEVRNLIVSTTLKAPSPHGHWTDSSFCCIQIDLISEWSLHLFLFGFDIKIYFFSSPPTYKAIITRIFVATKTTRATSLLGGENDEATHCDEKLFEMECQWDIKCCQHGEHWKENLTMYLVLNLFFYCRSLSLSLSLCGLWLSVVETVPPDLLTLTSACVKLRMTQRPPLQTCDASVWNSPRALLFYHEWEPKEMFFLLNGLLAAEKEQNQWLRGTLGVAVHSACGLQHPACTMLQTLKVPCTPVNDLPANLFVTHQAHRKYASKIHSAIEVRGSFCQQ